MAVDEQWYYHADGETHGPTTASMIHRSIRAKDLQPRTLIWGPGFTTWVPADSVDWPLALRDPSLADGGDKGDSDPKAYMIAAVGGIVGGLLAGGTATYAGAMIPTFIYQLGISDLDSLDIGLGDSQVERGITRVFIALFASLIPGAVGWAVGSIVSVVAS